MYLQKVILTLLLLQNKHHEVWLHRLRCGCIDWVVAAQTAVFDWWSKTTVCQSYEKVLDHPKELSMCLTVCCSLYTFINTSDIICMCACCIISTDNLSTTHGEEDCHNVFLLGNIYSTTAWISCIDCTHIFMQGMQGDKPVSKPCISRNMSVLLK